MFFICVVGSKNVLVCSCNKQSCITDGACLVYLDRFRSGQIRQYKTCSKPGKGYMYHFLCNDPKPDVHCCYFNMCNADVHLTFPPTKATTLTSNSGQGIFWDIWYFLKMFLLFGRKKKLFPPWPGLELTNVLTK